MIAVSAAYQQARTAATSLVPHPRSHPPAPPSNPLPASLQNGEVLAQPQAALQQVVALLALAALILAGVMKKGALLVDRPQLRPDLAHPWN